MSHRSLSLTESRTESDQHLMRCCRTLGALDMMNATRNSCVILCGMILRVNSGGGDFKRTSGPCFVQVANQKKKTKQRLILSLCLLGPVIGTPNGRGHPCVTSKLLSCVIDYGVQ